MLEESAFTDYFAGDIDDVHVFTGMLTRNDVLNLYLGSYTPT